MSYLLMPYTKTQSVQTDTLSIFVLTELDTSGHDNGHYTLYSNIAAAQAALIMLNGYGIIREKKAHDTALQVIK
jgi:hypothetical protein